MKSVWTVRAYFKDGSSADLTVHRTKGGAERHASDVQNSCAAILGIVRLVIIERLVSP